MNSSPAWPWLVALSTFVVCALHAQDDDVADAAELPEYTIAIVSDGDSWYFERAVEGFLAELKPLAEGKYNFVVRDAFDAGDNPAQVGPMLLEALADPEVDVVYASGSIATEQAGRLSEEARTKPVMAGALQFSDDRGPPISKEGTSKLKNFTFITEPTRVAADIEWMKELTKAKTIHVAIDELILPELKNLDEARAQVARRFGVEIRMHGVPATADGALARIPDGAEAVYVAILPRMEAAERKKFYEGLAKQGIPTLAMLGEEEVKLGAMAGLAREDSSTVARRTALNIHQLLQGVSTETLAVYLPVQDYPLVNAATAKTVGWSPTYDQSLSAHFINEEVHFRGDPINLVQAMNRAAQQNADVLIALEEERIRQLDVNITRSQLLPQADMVIEHGRTGFSNRIDPTSPAYSHQGTYGAQLRQVLFNDELVSNIRAQRRSATGASLDRESMKLDAMDAAAAAYFSYLQAKALYEIDKENLRLTVNNLHLARLRVDIGSAEPSDVYRWEQDAASSRAALIQREAERANTLVEFNRILGAPREKTWDFADMNVADDDFHFLNEDLKPVLETREQFEKFTTFLRWQAVERAPELLSFDYAIGAQGQILRQKQRRFYLPEVGLSLGYDRVVSGSELVETDSERQVSSGIQFSYPLFEGGKRKFEIAQQKATIRQLAAKREQAVQQIEQRTLTAVNNISAAHPNIRLNRQALASAEKNYEAVRDKYSLGAATIVDLLEAQTSLIRQKQEVAAAVYGYLTEIYAVQRSIAWYEFQQSPESRQRFVALVRAFVSGKFLGETTSRAVVQKEAAAAVEASQSDREAEARPTEAPGRRKRGFRSLFRKKR